MVLVATVDKFQRKPAYSIVARAARHLFPTVARRDRESAVSLTSPPYFLAVESATRFARRRLAV
jgi:hypothetical protein